MEISNQTKLLLLVVAVFALLYFMDNGSNTTSTTSEVPSEESRLVENMEDVPISESESEQEYDETEGVVPPEIVEDRIRGKVVSKNSAPEGVYKKSSYAGGSRGNDAQDDFYRFFDEGNDLIQYQRTNDEFKPQDEMGAGYKEYSGMGRETAFAPYSGGEKKKLSDEDIFKSSDFLPKDKNDDWFEVMPEPISVKSRHLINVSRPVGVTSIGSSLRNASWDIRGSPPCPKTVVSPWLQSTIEPDLNIKGLC